MKKIFVTAAVIIAAAAILTACRESSVSLNGGETKTETLTFWHFDSEHKEFYEKLALDYEKKHKGVKVEIQVIPRESYADEWLKASEDGRTPEVFAIPPESLNLFRDSGKLAALSYEKLVTEVSGQEPLITSGIDKTFLALPVAGSLPVIFYNRDIYEKNQLKEPETRSDFVVNCAILKQSGTVPLGLSLSETGNLEVLDLTAWALSNGDRVSGGKNINGDFKKLLSGTTGYYDLYGLAMELSVDKKECAKGHQALLKEFSKGSYAMIPGTTEDIALLKETMTSPFDWFLLPGEDYTKAGVWSGEILFGASKKGKGLKSAKDFLAGFMGQENQKAFSGEFNRIPAIRGLKLENKDVSKAYDLLSNKKEVYLSCVQTMTEREKEVCEKELDQLFSGNAVEPEEFLNDWLKQLKNSKRK